MKLRFLGAAGTVTGSKYLLTISKKHFLVDCGLFQGLKSLRLKNWQSLDIDPQSIGAIFLTHAHIDHSGYIPRLVEQGFKGPIYCSPGTYELSKILLPDSGYLQEEEARYANQKGYSKHKPALPLYTRDQALASLDYFHACDFNKALEVGKDIKVTFQRAGHILGASAIIIEAAGRKIVFSGDVGRFDDLIMRPPEPYPDTDYLVLESTYGDRSHEKEDVKVRLEKIVNEAYRRGGAIVIPAFAVGRAQHILYLLAQLKAAKKIPAIPTYLDSPMAINATDLYCKFSSEHRLSRSDCELMCRDVILTKTPAESSAINDKKGSKIIISASGMMSGGRILHHLVQYVSDPKNVIVIVGYQAIGTRGRQLMDGSKQIKIFGNNYEIHAKIENLTGISAHADREQLIHLLKQSHLKQPKIFLTHGEAEAAQSFKEKLEETFHWQVIVPEQGDEYDL